MINEMEVRPLLKVPMKIHPLIVFNAKRVFGGEELKMLLSSRNIMRNSLKQTGSLAQVYRKNKVGRLHSNAS